MLRSMQRERLRNVNVIRSKAEISFSSLHGKFMPRKSFILSHIIKNAHNSVETKNFIIQKPQKKNELRCSNINIFNTYNGSIQSKMTDKLSYKWLLSFSMIFKWSLDNYCTMMFRFVVNRTFTFYVAPLRLSPLLLLIIFFTLFAATAAVVVVVVVVRCFSPFFSSTNHLRFSLIVVDFQTLSPRLDQHRASEDKTSSGVPFQWQSMLVCLLYGSFDRSIDRSMVCAWCWKLPVISNR